MGAKFSGSYTEYDWASEHVADSGMSPDEAAMAAEEQDHPVARRQADDSAGILSASLRLIAERTGGNPFLLLAVLGRIGGMTLKEIGTLSGCTKQAVDKHLREIGKRDPKMAAMLRRRWSYQAAMDPAGAALTRLGVIDIAAIREPIVRGRRHWPPGPASIQPWLSGLG